MKKLAKGFSLVELMIVVAIIGILSAVAIPNFMKFQAKSRQSEVKQNLGGLHTAVTTYFAEKNKFPASDNVAGFKVEGNNIYAYASISGIDSADKSFTASQAQPAADFSKPSSGEWLSGAIGNIDNDSFEDGWAINSYKCLANDTSVTASDKGSACIAKQDSDANNDVNQE